jgi:hypothetical protein
VKRMFFACEALALKTFNHMHSLLRYMQIMVQCMKRDILVLLGPDAKGAWPHVLSFE